MQRDVKFVIKKSNIIIEVVDVRLWKDLINPKIKEICNRANKGYILVLNKIDLVSKSYLKEINIEDGVFVSTKLRKGIDKLKYKIKKIIKEKAIIENYGKAIIGVVGVVNVGKSSLINALKFKHSARTSPIPGFTKGRQIIKLSSKIYLFDTPGIYKLNKKDIVSELYSINPKDYERIGKFIIELALNSNPNTLYKNYKISIGNEPIENIVIKIGKRLGYYKKNNEIDLEKVYRKLFYDWHKGKIKAWKIY